MDLTQLMTNLDEAVDLVEAKKAALESAQAAAAATIKQATDTVQAASAAHQGALGDYLDLRRQLDTALDTVGTKGPASVTVNG